MAQASSDPRHQVAEEPEEIRDQMEDTRSALTEKLETLEERVKETVHAAQTTVHDTVESVKETVQDTVQTVKRTFDLRHQVEEHPWIMFGGSVLAGYVVGSFVGSRELQVERPARDEKGTASPWMMAQRASQDGGAKGGIISKLTDRFGDEIEILQSAAIGALMGLARDWLKHAVPPIAPQLDKAMNSATSKLGGEPIAGPVMKTANI